MSEARSRILGAVRAALAPLPRRAEPPAWSSDELRLKEPAEAGDLAAHFTRRVALLGGHVLAQPGALREFLIGHGRVRGYCDPRLRAAAFGGDERGLEIEEVFDRSRLDAYEFGVTAAFAGIAETGTVMLSDAGTPFRLAALAPWAHVAVLRRSAIVSDLSAGIAVLPNDPNIVWCTGPSKTADVEGILIHGVHGPGIQAVLLVD